MAATPQISGPPMGDDNASVDYWTEDECPITVRVEYPDNVNGVDIPETCRFCGNDIREEEGVWLDEQDSAECIKNDEEDDEDILGPHAPDLSSENHPSRWLNSARVVVGDEEVTCTVSVGDPRGAFAFTVRRNPQGDGFLIHTPYAGEAMPHMATEQLQPGTLRTL